MAYTAKSKVTTWNIIGWLLLGMLIGVLCAAGYGCATQTSSHTATLSEPIEEPTVTTTSHTFSEAFGTDGLACTVSPVFTSVAVDESTTALKVPVNMFNGSAQPQVLHADTITFIGPDGTAIRNLGQYFDDDVSAMSPIEINGEGTTYLYPEWVGAGEYTISFMDADGNVNQVVFPMGNL